jgi:hypothetical protein
VDVVERSQHFLQESNNRRMSYGLAIAGHVIIALLLLLGFFERPSLLRLPQCRLKS